MATIAQAVPQEVLLETTVKSVPVPKGVRFRRAYFDTDSTGDAAMFAIFGVSRKFGTGSAEIKKLRDLRKNVQDALEILGTGAFAYVHFEDGL